MVEYKEDSVYYTEVLYITAIYSFINTYFTSPAINHLKHTIQWFLEYWQNYATITPINFRKISSSQKETPFPFVITLQLPN